MNRGDIYLVSLGPTQGPEQRGSRPVLVISPTPFNWATKLPVVLPIISGETLRAALVLPFRYWVHGRLESFAAISRECSTCMPVVAGRWRRFRRTFWMTCSPGLSRCFRSSGGFRGRCSAQPGGRVSLTRFHPLIPGIPGSGKRRFGQSFGETRCRNDS